MNPQTASQVANKWLNAAGVVSPPSDRVATALENAVPEPDAWECSLHGQLVMLTRKGLWVGTATHSQVGDLTGLEIHRFDLRSVQATFTESYASDSAGTHPEWRFVVGGGELTFRAAAPVDDPISFGSRVAEALDS